MSKRWKLDTPWMQCVYRSTCLHCKSWGTFVLHWKYLRDSYLWVKCLGTLWDTHPPSLEGHLIDTLGRRLTDTTLKHHMSLEEDLGVWNLTYNTIVKDFQTYFYVYTIDCKPKRTKYLAIASELSGKHTRIPFGNLKDLSIFNIRQLLENRLTK